MIRGILVMLAVLAVFLLNLGLVAEAGRIDGLDGQLRQARAQFSAQERNDRAAQRSISRDLITAERQLLAARARLASPGHDIDCPGGETGPERGPDHENCAGRKPPGHG